LDCFPQEARQSEAAWCERGGIDPCGGADALARDEVRGFPGLKIQTWGTRRAEGRDSRRKQSLTLLICVHICAHNEICSMTEIELEFEWDEAKAKSNLEKHGVSFLTAAAIFSNERLERIDDREDYGELRWIALGRVGIEVYRIVFTWRGGNLIRIVSAQKASKDEQEIYYREAFS
jgi:uncharacterized DUF497 family protein